jgi:hypothetical protein
MIAVGPGFRRFRLDVGKRVVDSGRDGECEDEAK